MQGGGNVNVGFRQFIKPLDGPGRINRFQLDVLFQQNVAGLIWDFHQP